MKSFPDHYRPYFHLYLRFSIVMMVLGLLVGIMFQESSKKAPISAALPSGTHLEAIFNLSLVHGHTFLIGALIPLALLWILYLGLQLDFAPLSNKILKMSSWLYIPGAASSILLLLYKGYHYVLGVRFGQSDLAVLNHALFGGNHSVRAAVYGLSHTCMAVGLGILVVCFWQSMKQKTLEPIREVVEQER